MWLPSFPVAISISRVSWPIFVKMLYNHTGASESTSQPLNNLRDRSEVLSHFLQEETEVQIG